MTQIVQLALAAALTALVAGLLETITPQGGARRVVSVCGGILLLLMLLRPFSGLLSSDDWVELNGKNDDIAAAIQDSGQEIIKKFIEERTGAYILNKSDNLGLNVKVEVICTDDVLAPTPWSVTIRSKTPEHAKNALQKMIEDELGIPRERQSYELKEGMD